MQDYNKSQRIFAGWPVSLFHDRLKMTKMGLCKVVKYLVEQRLGQAIRNILKQEVKPPNLYLKPM